MVTAIANGDTGTMFGTYIEPKTEDGVRCLEVGTYFLRHKTSSHFEREEEVQITSKLWKVTDGMVLDNVLKPCRKKSERKHVI